MAWKSLPNGTVSALSTGGRLGWGSCQLFSKPVAIALHRAMEHNTAIVKMMMCSLSNVMKTLDDFFSPSFFNRVEVYLRKTKEAC